MAPRAWGCGRRCPAAQQGPFAGRCHLRDGEPPVRVAAGRGGFTHMLATVPSRQAAEWLAWDPVGHAFGLFGCASPRQRAYAWFGAAGGRAIPAALLIQRAGWWLFPRGEVDLRTVAALVRAGTGPRSLTLPRWLAPMAARAWTHVPAADSSLWVCTADDFSPSDQHPTQLVTPALFARLGLGRTAFPGVLSPLAAAECAGRLFVALRAGEAAAIAQGAAATPQVRAVEQVLTRPEWRGQGFGRSVVSGLTRDILAEGRLPIYQVQDDNLPSLRLAHSLGYWRHSCFTTFYFD